VCIMENLSVHFSWLNKAEAGVSCGSLVCSSGQHSFFGVQELMGLGHLGRELRVSHTMCP
jgi:hypothetical protein